MKSWKLALCIFLPLAGALLCIFGIFGDRHQAGMPIPITPEFVGEYSYDKENWYPLNEEAELSADKEMLTIRGHFTQNMDEGVFLSVFCKHIGVSMTVNGETVYLDMPSELMVLGMEQIPAACGVRWEHMCCPALYSTDEVEFCFINPHTYGNKDAYRRALESFYVTPNVKEVLVDYLQPYIRPLEYAGYGIIILAAMVLGASLYAALLKNKASVGLFLLGVTAFFAGSYLLLDIMETYFRAVPLALRTYGGQISRILTVYFAGLFMARVLTKQRKQVATMLMLFSGMVLLVLFGLVVMEERLLYDILGYWALLQMVSCPVLILCSIWELLFGAPAGRINPICAILFFGSVLVDITGVADTYYNQGMCFKFTFAVLALAYLLRGVKQVMTEHQASVKNEQLEKELENNRVTLMISQIQPHFLYNSLTCVMDLCDRNPKLAKNAIADFADYLRGNLNALSTKHPVSFDKELEHVEKYLRLEKLRFGEELQIQYNITTKDFVLPALSVQPLVENAVKHGIGQKPGGGMVQIATKETKDSFEICITDDGVGFEEEDYQNDGNLHIGIENIKKRLELIHARLEINSRKGEGTTVRVLIPKER